jgi:amino acid transporter
MRGEVGCDCIDWQDVTSANGNLERSLTLRGALALNLLDMIGVGPFLTLPLLLAAMGGPQAMVGWVLGALLAACDGLVWAELGAAMPEAGGTYRYLAEMFPGRWGRWLSFLFVFQLCLSAPLSIASGCIGLSQYAGFLWPSLRGHAMVHAARVGGMTLGVSVGRETALAIVAMVLAVALQTRKVGKLRGLSLSLLGVVLATIAWAVATGLMRGHIGAVFAFPANAWRMDGAFWAGLGSAMLIATYDYWGYYNVTFLGGEVRDAARVIPRVVLGSIAIVGVLYLLLNASVLSVLGAPEMLRSTNMEARRALLSAFMFVAWSPVVGAGWAMLLAKLAALLVMVAAFASVFSLLLGYSRIPFAAARDGNFLRVFGRLDRGGSYPVVSLLALAVVGSVCCFFSLAEVIAALVVLRIVLQFALQHVGVMVWRRRKPEAERPFRMWLYPLPPMLALLGFGYIVASRVGSARQVVLALVVAVLGTVVFALRRKPSKT